MTAYDRIRQMSTYVKRGMDEGWLRGKDADHALDVVQAALVEQLDADIARCQRQQQLHAEGYSLREVLAMTQPELLPPELRLNIGGTYNININTGGTNDR